MKTLQNLHQFKLVNGILVAVVILFSTHNPTPAQRITKPNEPGPLPGLSVNTCTGNLVYQRSDLSIPGRGLSTAIAFTYNSGRSQRDWGYGHGWSFTYGMRYYRSGDTVFIDRDDGQRDPFVLSGSVYQPSKGNYDDLREYAKGKFVLTTKYGFRYFFADSVFRNLTGLRDRNGNEVLLNYSGGLLSSILDASGRMLNFSWSAGHLTEITDPNPDQDRTIAFQYDGSWNLVRVTDPLEHSSSYDYGEWDNLTSVTDARGTRVTIFYNENSAVSGITCVAADTKKTFGYSLKDLTTSVTEYLGSSQRTTRYTFDAGGRIVRIQYPDGNAVQYAWDQSNNITVYSDENGITTIYSYDDRGNLLKELDYLSNSKSATYTSDYNQVDVSNDKNGRTWLHTYDTRGNLLKLTDPSGNYEEYTYDQFGNQTTWKTKNGSVWQFSYNNNGYLIQRTDAEGHSELFNYDQAGNAIERTDQNDNKDHSYYDALNKPVRLVNSLGFERILTYDETGNVLSDKHAGGGQFTNVYDALGRKIRSTDPLGNVTDMEYDEAGNLTVNKDANGGVTRYAYDSRNRLTGETDPLGYSMKYAYDAAGNRISSTDRRNNTTTYSWDGLRRMTVLTDPSGLNEIYGYDPCGNQTSFSDKNGRKYLFVYNDLNELARINDPEGGSILYSYDPKGNRISETDQNGNNTQYAFDEVDRLIRKTDATGNVQTLSYDPAGNLVKETDENGNPTGYAYDAANRMIKSTGASGHSHQYLYDAAGNVISEINSNGSALQNEYDLLNRRVKVTSPMGHVTHYAYDAVGNLIRRTDPEFRQTNYTYDLLDRLILTAYPAGTVEQGYDANGNKLLIKNMGIGLGDITERTYDAMDRLTSEKINYGPFSKTVSYTYDAVGNIVQVTDPDGRKTNYGFNDQNQLTLVAGPFSDTSRLTYDPSGAYSGFHFPNGERNQSIYDTRNRLVMKETRNPSNEVIFRFDYKYDSLGQISEVMRNGIPEAKYYYDQDHRLVNAVYPFQGKNVIYGYDAVGNRQSEVDQGLITSFTYNAENRVISQIMPNLNTINYQYDQNGNVVRTTSNWGTVNYSYDYENRMTAINYPPPFGTILTFYSPEGNRLARFERAVKTYFYPTLLGNLIEMDENGKTITRLNPGISQANITTDTPDIVYQHWDGQLSTPYFTGHSIVASVSFDYFGEILQSTGDLGQVDAALYCSGNKIDWDPLLGAELTASGFAPDINQYFGNTSFEPWNVPDFPFNWLDDLTDPATPTDSNPADGTGPVTPGAEPKKSVELCGFRENIWETTGSEWVYVGCYVDKDYLPQKRLIFKYEKKQQQKEVTVTCWLEKGHPGHHMDSEREDTGKTRLESYKPPFYDYKKSGALEEWPDAETRDKAGKKILDEKNKKGKK